MNLAYQLRWLKPDDYSGAAQQFAHYCLEHAQQYADIDQQSLDAAIRLALDTLDNRQKEPIAETNAGDTT